MRQGDRVIWDRPLNRDGSRRVKIHAVVVKCDGALYKLRVPNGLGAPRFLHARPRDLTLDPRYHEVTT